MLDFAFVLKYFIHDYELVPRSEKVLVILPPAQKNISDKFQVFFKYQIKFM
jgi:hypothetical protein